jgi:hypothetical protein
MKAKETAPDRSAWQFSLRSLMIGITLFAMVLGSGMWLDGLGVLGCVFLIVLALLGYAIHSRRKQLILGTSIFMLVCIVGFLIIYFFGPYSIRVYRCGICGQKKDSVAVLTWVIYQKEYETAESDWYREMQLDTHEHRWEGFGYQDKFWGGSNKYSIDLWCLTVGEDELRLFIKAAEDVDKATFLDMAKEHQAIGDNQERKRIFCDRCSKILYEKRVREQRRAKEINKDGSSLE